MAVGGAAALATGAAAMAVANKAQEKEDYDASEDYSEFEAEDLEDNTDARKNNNVPVSNILANIPDLKTNDKDSDKL